MKKQIPNLFTLMNLLFGCLSIVATMQHGLSIQYNPEGIQYLDIPEEIFWASLFIGLSAVVDFFDGFVARWLDAVSEMGKQLDSLADVVSFGVAPSMIMFQFLRLSLSSGENGLNLPMLYLFPAFLLALSAAYRLARFNISLPTIKGFEGLPSPAAGLFIASFPLIYWQSSADGVAMIFTNPWFNYGIILFVSWLMISKLKLFSLKITKGPIAAYTHLIILLLLAILSAFFFQWLSIPITFMGYIVLSLIFKNKIS
ncbi:MAG: CDP-diacylglycerol--serine O-phosphatidyltransferase [Bacteroidota bacterium]|jgi:CDP-diacylglycerol--serine O-phosphatidyltransferase